MAKGSTVDLACTPSRKKDHALRSIIAGLKKGKANIIRENSKDVARAIKEGIPNPLIKRLVIDDSKFNEMIKGLESIIKLEDPVGKILSSMELDKGLILDQVTCPIGVIGTIFESRPDALVQIASLCLKSGNACVLKGGFEARNSNRALFRIIETSTKRILPKGWIQLAQTREDVKRLLKLDQYIDLIIPRGSNRFVKYIQSSTKIPVLGHSEGICHIYVDKSADLRLAQDIIIDSKCQYPAACNAVETLLIHRDIATKFLPMIVETLRKSSVEVRLEKSAISSFKISNVKVATEKDWRTEYSDLIIAIKVVKDIEEAISHINTYGSHHTDAIIAKDQKSAGLFMQKVDSGSVLHNCSTRFADGFRYGKGAEVGISTYKIHSRGPVGMEGLIIYKYRLKGKGHLVAAYCGAHPKRFTHKRLL
ncbi:MAG TPA: glutamate-5-semialdehyde dehydrogenase [Candidatus Nanoarchaeia archaeon]|nr:glutamate-5-semialdehyde dehydrogenase [Candidatus Nanoarchaeia archaeon]